MLKPIFNVLCWTILIAISAQLTIVIPGIETPMTGQTFLVSLVIYGLPLHQASLTILLYLGLGVLGFPVFADGASGFHHLTGPTGGYLYGFLFACLMMHVLHQKRRRTHLERGFYFILVTFYIVLSGYIHLSIHIGIQLAWLKGVLPFLPGALFKILMAWAIITIHEYRTLHRSNNR